jgi:hypothetical protein
MFTARPSAFAALALALAMSHSAQSQSVISTHSGIIHFVEGAVFLDGQAVQSRLGKYQSVPQGSELRTEAGHAEVLLTPGVFLRLSDHSAVRMVSNDLGDTQLELRSGEAIVESGEPNADTSVTLSVDRWRVHFLKKGAYRMASAPPRVWVHEGAAEVSTASGPKVAVEQGEDLPLADVLVPQRNGAEPKDSLTDWSKGRGDSIIADDAVTAQIDEDPADRSVDADAFGYLPGVSYFPMVSLLPPNLYGGAYGSVATQPGFNSIYLPGYTSLPYLFGPSLMGIRRTSLYSPARPVFTPGVSPGGISIGRPGGFVPYQPIGIRPAGGIIGARPLPTIPASHPLVHPVAPHALGHR